jgi:hypothetical protein
MKRAFLPRSKFWFFQKRRHARRPCRAFSDTPRSQHGTPARMKKNFAPEASAGVLTLSTRRKSRESVPTDSRRSTFADRATRLAATIRIPDCRSL